MIPTQTIFADAIISHDGVVHWTLTPWEIYLVESGDERFWFEARIDYAEDGQDFRIVVWNFGLNSRQGAGGRAGYWRRDFTYAEARAAKAMLSSFFLGSRYTPGLPDLPFRNGRGRCTGVDFPPDWISTAWWRKRRRGNEGLIPVRRLKPLRRPYDPKREHG